MSGTTKLRFRVFKDNQALIDEYRREQNVILGSEGEYIYEHSNRTLYAQRTGPGNVERTQDSMRQWVLYYQAIQFYNVARNRTTTIEHKWYEQGLPWLAMNHFWNGKDVELPILPMFKGDECFMAHGRSAVNGGHFDIKGLVEGTIAPTWGATTSFMSWMYCSTDDQRKKFHRMCTRIDRGDNPGTAFRAEFGEYEKAMKDFEEWLSANQPPFQINEGSAVTIGPGKAMLNQGRTRGVSLTHTEGHVDWIQATLIAPAGKVPGAGLVVSYVSKDDITALVFSTKGEWEILRVQGGTWRRIGDAVAIEPGRDKNKRVLKAERKEGKLVWTVDGKEGGSLELPMGGMGLVSNTEARFEDVNMPGYMEKKTSSRPARGAK